MNPLLNHPYVKSFIKLVEEWNAAGWGEYLLYETLEGIRDRPFKLMDMLPKADMVVLRTLRDELKVWPYWDGPTNAWDVVDIEVWREFAKETPSDLIRDFAHSLRERQWAAAHPPQQGKPK